MWASSLRRAGKAAACAARAPRRLLSTPAADSPGSRLTKIVATIGPASEEAAPLAACVAAGLNVMRCNFSHATRDEFFLRKKNLRAAPGGELCAIMLDTKGPEIRMGGLRVCRETGERKAKVKMVAGSEIVLTTDAAYDGDSDAETLYIGYEALRAKLSEGDTVLLDDGLISLAVMGPDTWPAEGVRCTVSNTSEIGERKGVNLPGIVTDLPAMSEKDIEDIRFGVENDIDMVAASFVRNAEGVRQIRAHLEECHAKYGNPDDPIPLIISKIESTEALDNLDEIIEESDGIMVARGDLGVEIPLQDVVIWQKDIVDACEEAGVPVVVATQMLESMQKNPRPTRAEVADVTNAVLERADAVMLSGESANGSYPSESVGMQASIIASAELWASARRSREEPRVLARMASGTGPNELGGAMEEGEDDLDVGPIEGIAAAATFLAQSCGASAICIGEDGKGDDFVRAVAACKPDMPIAAASPSLKVCRQLSIYRAVHPVHVPSGSDADASAIMEELTADELAACAARAGLVEDGALVVALTSDGTISLAEADVELE